MMRVFVRGVGIWAPGLIGWMEAKETLAGRAPSSNADVRNPLPDVLPANEFRRSSDVVRLALQVAAEAIQHAGAKPQEVCTVFASCDGDGAILHKLCLALSTPERAVSPTLFHHSVHNAAAGYWSIATCSQTPSTSISCDDASFAGGMLESAAQVTVEGVTALLVVYDVPAPRPLYGYRSLPAAFGMAMVLDRAEAAGSHVRLDVSLVNDSSGYITRMTDARLESLRNSIPAARGLPILQAIARQLPATIYMDYLGTHQLRVEVSPCQ